MPGRVVVPVFRSVRARPLVHRVAACVLIWLVCAGLTLAAGPLIASAKFIFFWIAVLCCAWALSCRAAVLAAIASLLAVDYFLVLPLRALGALSGVELMTFAIWVVVSGLVSGLAANLAAKDEQV